MWATIWCEKNGGDQDEMTRISLLSLSFFSHGSCQWVGYSHSSIDCLRGNMEWRHFLLRRFRNRCSNDRRSPLLVWSRWCLLFGKPKTRTRLQSYFQWHLWRWSWRCLEEKRGRSLACRSRCSWRKEIEIGGSIVGSSIEPSTLPTYHLQISSVRGWARVPWIRSLWVAVSSEDGRGQWKKEESQAVKKAIILIISVTYSR